MMDGNNLDCVGGEIIQSQKKYSGGLIWGLISRIVLSVLTTQAYLNMLHIDELKISKMLTTDALFKVMGVGGASVIALLIMISTAGATNGNILPTSRITYAMAKDNVFFSAAGKIDKRFHTPYISLWLQCIWSCLFVLSGSFDLPADLFVFVTWIFYGFAAYGIIILRRNA